MLEVGYAPLFKAISAWATKQEAVQALFLSGSVAQGCADAFSDLDFVVVTHQDEIETLTTEVRAVIDDNEPIIIENRLSPGPVSILSVVTDKWHRIDFVFGAFDSGVLHQTLLPVFDPDTLYKDTGTPAQSSTAAADADTVIMMSKEFLRIVGLAVVVLGRKDVHAAHDGVNLLRNILIDLFLLEPPLRTRSGAKKLLPVLTDEQQEILKSLPAVSDDMETIIAFTSAIAEVFLPRARHLVESIDGIWPVAAEQATLAYFQRIKTAAVMASEPVTNI